jgi:hypothetical protein
MQRCLAADRLIDMHKGDQRTPSFYISRVGVCLDVVAESVTLDDMRRASILIGQRSALRSNTRPADTESSPVMPFLSAQVSCYRGFARSDFARRMSYAKVGKRRKVDSLICMCMGERLIAEKSFLISITRQKRSTRRSECGAFEGGPASGCDARRRMQPWNCF